MRTDPYFAIDVDMPFEWLVDVRDNSLGGSPKGAPRVTEIFGRVNPWVRDGGSGGVEDQNDRVYADTPTMRAAAANHLHKGADGICECTCCPPYHHESTLNAADACRHSQHALASRRA